MARILVVDNDKTFRLTCAEDLELEGHDVFTAETGFDALRLDEEHALDMVITEVRLPGMDGLELMSRLLAKHRGIIVILNSCSSRYKESFLSWAADAYVMKSADIRELRAKVRELLSLLPSSRMSEGLPRFQRVQRHGATNTENGGAVREENDGRLAPVLVRPGCK